MADADKEARVLPKVSFASVRPEEEGKIVNRTHVRILKISCSLKAARADAIAKHGQVRDVNRHVGKFWHFIVSK